MIKRALCDDKQEKTNQWFSPEELDRERLKYEKMDPALATADNDFGSYAKVSRGNGLNDSCIEKHNLINCDARAKLYFILLGSKKLSSIADIGCGIGLTTIALSKAFRAKKVTGIDISQDAINFARKNSVRGIEYFAQRIEPGTLLTGPYDLVVAQEFYPFTRTSDYQTHINFIEVLMRSLKKPRGIILIGLSDGTSESILDNLEKITVDVESMGGKLSIHFLPYEKLFKITRSYLLSKLITRFVGFFIDKNKFVVIKISC